MANERNFNTFLPAGRRFAVGDLRGYTSNLRASRRGVRKWGAVLVVVAALALPLSAFAQDGELSIYGTLHPFLDNFRTTGATPDQGLSPSAGGANQVTQDDYTGENLPARFRITSGTSHIGFRGNLRLGEHVKAFFQVESTVGPDGDSPVLMSPWAARNSGVGLTGDYGTLFFGNWDTPYKYPTMYVGALRGLNPFDNTLTGNPGFNVPGTTAQNGRANSKADAAFNRRQGNSVQYWTPMWQGLSARVACSMNEGRTRTTEVEPSTNPIVWSVLLSYEYGPLSVHYAYEQHLDYFGLSWIGGSPGASFTNASSNDDAHEIVAWHMFPTGTRVAAIVERLTYRTNETTAGLLNRYQRDAVYGAVQQRVGMHTVWGSFGVAGSGRCSLAGGGACTTNGLEGRQWSIGYTFSPAKTVDLFASYYEMDNGRSGTYALIPAVVPIAPGSTTRGFGVGILYLFDVSMGFGASKPAEAPAASPEPPAPAPPAEPPAAAPAPPGTE
jgi:predicted porin